MSKGKKKKSFLSFVATVFFSFCMVLSGISIVGDYINGLISNPIPTPPLLNTQSLIQAIQQTQTSIVNIQINTQVAETQVQAGNALTVIAGNKASATPSSLVDATATIIITQTSAPTKTITPSATPTYQPPLPTMPLYPAGITAVCKDGTYSYSKSARGTCSRHGGVRIWINHPP